MTRRSCGREARSDARQIARGSANGRRPATKNCDVSRATKRDISRDAAPFDRPAAVLLHRAASQTSQPARGVSRGERADSAHLARALALRCGAAACGDRRAVQFWFSDRFRI
ncbi:hypothetical protein F511_47051 [Dorcoceras hygrometricum]|uniref:Uncharacterized protein n=1 Tax=Dorcoceras hygrometricum TaxID=472368 RepID=A0A2Z6ZRZ6_9LAMI|nr:hypothetical protein F511_47051 [Dorcoceras hygrometricum]